VRNAPVIQEKAASFFENTFFAYRGVWLIVLATLAALGILAGAQFVPGFLALVLLAIVGGAIGLATLVRPELALLITVAYIPFGSPKFTPIPLPGDLTLTKVLGSVLLGVLFFQIVFRRRPFRLLDDLHDFIILLFGATMLFSGVTSAFPEDMLDALLRLLRLFAFYFAVKNLVTSPRQVRPLMWAIIITGAIASTVGLIEFFQTRTVRVHDIRVRGVLDDPNDFAAAMVVVVMVGLYLFRAARDWHAKLAVGVMVGIVVAAIVLSGSRGGLVSFAVVAVLFVWRQPRRTQLLGALAAIALLSFPFWPESTRQRLRLQPPDETATSQEFEVAQSSARRRASYHVFGASLIAEQPLLGYGIGTFGRYYPESEFARFDNPLREEDFSRVAHNTYLEVAVGSGLVGLGFYLLMFFVSWYHLHKVGRQAPRGSFLWAAASAFELALIGLMISNLFLSIQHFKYLWLSVGMSSSLAYYARQVADPNPLPERVE
jgi:O-antigen ligase